MNEKFEENYENVEETATDSTGILSPVLSGDVGGDDGATPGRISEVTVSGGDAETNVVPGVYVVDSVGRTLYLDTIDTLSEMELVENETQSEVLYSADTLAVLEAIDYKLSIIMFLLLFYWCAHKIKNAVRGFTGRGIDD